MKINIYLIFVCLVSLSCNNINYNKTGVINEPVQPKVLSDSEKLEAHIKTIKNEKDTILLGFILGSSKLQVNNHINQLIREGKITPPRTLQTRHYTGVIMEETTGYPYTLYLENDTRLSGLIVVNYSDGKLFSINLKLYAGYDVNKVVRLLNAKYGNYKKVETIDALNTYSWFRNNTEIITAGSVSSGDISYIDLKKKFQDFKDLIITIKNNKQVHKLKQENTKKEI